MSVRITQGALVLAAGGAIVILLGLLGEAASIAGLVAIIAGTVLAARPAGRGPRGGWWTLLAAGAVLSMAGALLSIATASIGGLLALIGGIAVVAGAAMGYPQQERTP